MKSYSKPGDSCGTVALIVFFIALLATILKKKNKKTGKRFEKYEESILRSPNPWDMMIVYTIIVLPERIEF